MGFTLSNPWVAKDYTYKGQLHCHSTESDGADTPTEIVTAYKDADYDFVCLTDHNTATADPEVSGILFIPGVEEDAANGHLGAINVSANSSLTNNQALIEAIVNAGGLACVNHPNWSGDVWYDADILGMVGFKLLEVWNAKVAPNENADTKYDNCISTPHKRVWCVAVDDCHDKDGSGFNKGWIMVNADELTISAVMAQIAAGNFYASTGAVISNIALSGNQITVTTDASASIKWIKSGGTEIKTTTGATSDSYTTSSADGYVRVIITRDSDSKQAWSQPLFWIEDAAPDDSYTKLLLHFEGSDSGQVVEDECKKAVGVAGGACTKTAWKKFGNTSGYCDGTGDYFVIENHADFEPGSGDFTIDCWIRPGSVSNETLLFGHHVSGVYDGYTCQIMTGGYLYFVASTNGTSYNVELKSATALSVDTEYHVAIVRDGDTWGMFINGRLEAAVVVTGTVASSYSSFYVGGGQWQNYLRVWTGYIDEFRFSKGIARWPVAVDVPTSEAVYDADNDKLLLLMNGTDGQQVFTDESGKTVTVNGNTYTEADIKKFGNASGYFDGSGDYLSLADSDDFKPGAGDFCFDFWIYPASVASNKSLFSKHASGDYDEYYCYFSATGKITFNATVNGSSWGVQLTSPLAITANAWYHIAIFRDGDYYYMLINGSPVVMKKVSGTIQSDTNVLKIGAHNSYYYQGYIDDFRFAKGISRYDMTITVPTEAYGPEEEPPAEISGIFFAAFM